MSKIERPKEIHLEQLLFNMEKAYGNCRLEGQEVEYIGNEQEFIDLYEEAGIKVIIPEEGVRVCSDNFYKKWNIKH